jgi:hypothetical protein
LHPNYYQNARLSRAFAGGGLACGCVDPGDPFPHSISIGAIGFTVKIERASRLKIGRGGVELLEEIVRGSIVTGHQGGTATTEEFEKLAHEYDHLDIENPAERITARRRWADRLGDLALRLRLARSTLSTSKSEGKLVASATAIVLSPMSRDLAALEKAAETANFNFTRYRIVLALAPSLSRPGISADTLGRIKVILNNVENRPTAQTEPSLLRIIDKTRAAVSDLITSAN